MRRVANLRTPTVVARSGSLMVRQVSSLSSVPTPTRRGEWCTHKTGADQKTAGEHVVGLVDNEGVGAQTRHGRVGMFSQGAYSVNQGDEWGAEAKRKQRDAQSLRSVHRRSMTMARSSVSKIVTYVTKWLGSN